MTFPFNAIKLHRSETFVALFFASDSKDAADCRPISDICIEKLFNENDLHPTT
jgi:hypothetical protein